jgi:hypothetical protein
MTKSTLPILDVYKTSAKKEDPRGKLNKAQSDNLKVQSDLAQASYNTLHNQPHDSAPVLEALGSLRKDFGEKPTGWGAFGAGLTEGLALGEKQKSILDDKKRLERYTSTLDKLQAYAEEAQGRLAEAQKKEEIKEGLSPYVSRTLDLIMEGAPQERIDLAGIDLARRLSAVSGDTLEYAMGNGNGLTLVNPETGEDTYVTWEDLAAPNIQEKVMMANPVYQSQLLRQQQMEAHDMALQERTTAAQELRAQASMQKAQSAGTGSQKASEGQQSPKDRERETYLRLQELLTQGDPTIGAGTRLSQTAAQYIPGWGSGLDAAQQEYQQLVADLKGQRFKKYGYRNEAEFNHVKTLDPALSRTEALKFVQNELAKLDQGNHAAPQMQTQSSLINQDAARQPDRKEAIIQELRKRGRIQ